MQEAFLNTVLRSTGASSAREVEQIQSLWSGYGKIARYALEGSQWNTVVVKLVRQAPGGSHPRGWNTGLSHQRKLRSYEVECQWYSKWSNRCSQACCRIPAFLGENREGESRLLVMEDIDAAGFDRRLNKITGPALTACLRWLANFHAEFLQENPDGLWPVGTYWHLDTRPDELEALEDESLRLAAPSIDQALNQCRFKTFVHGDAKLANFCFTQDCKAVAAVDFQYVGGGCGMKDLAYFLGSCLSEEECEAREAEVLDFYFDCFRSAVKSAEVSLDEVEEEWRTLYPIAWADFHRFLKGWSPGHWKLNDYSERVAREVIAKFNPPKGEANGVH